MMAPHTGVSGLRAHQLLRYVRDQASILGCAEAEILRSMMAAALHVRLGSPNGKPSMLWADLFDLIAAEMERRHCLPT